MEITFNNEKNGIEIRFESKPAAEIIDGMKLNGFRWSNKQRMWYAKQGERTIAFARSLRESEGSYFSARNDKQEKHGEYDLWEMTRTDGIENNFAKFKIYDCKEIAAIIRKHLRNRFPMCKWSVISGCNKIDVTMKSSPWGEESDEAKAIAHYAFRFTQSYNYNNSDPMTDYFDVNFYGSYESSIIDRYDYEQREMTVSEMNMSARFAQSKKEWEAAEAERQERELQESMARMEVERIESKRIEAETKAKVERIESEAVVEDADFFVLNCKEPNTSKESSISGYDDSNFVRTKCGISRTVHMPEDVYDMFSNLLMRDYSFLAKKGESHTDDLRINSEADFRNMSKEERETVEWYSVDCIAVYRGNELKIVIDPQGFDCARYVFFVDEESKIASGYKGSTGITEEEAQMYSELADDIEDASTKIIEENGIYDSWNGTDFNLYQREMINWIEQNGFNFTVDVVRAVKIEELKVALYRVLNEYNGIQEQFRRAGLEEDQKITVIRISDFGGVAVTHAKVKSATNTSYAQYDRAVRLVMRPERKRNNYYINLYRDVLIYDGYVDIPEDLLFDISEMEINGHTVRTKQSKYTSCDNRQYADVLKYFAEHGKKPLVNTTGINI